MKTKAEKEKNLINVFHIISLDNFMYFIFDKRWIITYKISVILIISSSTPHTHHSKARQWWLCYRIKARTCQLNHSKFIIGSFSKIIYNFPFSHSPILLWFMSFEMPKVTIEITSHTFCLFFCFCFLLETEWLLFRYEQMISDCENYINSQYHSSSIYLMVCRSQIAQTAHSSWERKKKEKIFRTLR